MARYKLRNGLEIDLTWEKVEAKAFTPSVLEFDKKAASLGRLHCKTTHMNTDAIPAFEEHGLKMKAIGIVSGGSSDVAMACKLRFIQFLTVQRFGVIYFGKRAEEGSINWNYAGRILQRTVDARVPFDSNGIPDAARTSAPFQFGDEVNDRTPPNKLTAKLGDSPSERVSLLEFNSASKKFNYLFSLSLLHQFETIATFVHRDGSREMLESWHWTYRRVTGLKWKALQPELTTDRASIVPAGTSTVVFGRDAEFETTIQANVISNIICNEAILNRKNSPNIQYSTSETAQVFPHESYWDP